MIRGRSFHWFVVATLLAPSPACGPDLVSASAGGTSSTDESSEDGPSETETTESETETDTETTETDDTDETETGDDSEPVLEGEIPEGECTITPGPSADALCGGGPCPLTTDVHVWCDSSGFGADPVAIAPGNDGPRLLVGGENDWLFALSGGEGEILPFPQGAPFGFPRFAQDSAGELVVVGVIAGFFETRSWPQGIYRLAPLDATQWVRESGPGGDYSNNMQGLEVDVEDRIHVWTGADPVYWITRDASGVWAEEQAPSLLVEGPRTLTVDGQTVVVFGYIGPQLYVWIDGDNMPLGDPRVFESEMIALARPPKPSWAGIGPQFVVTATHAAGTHIHWLDGQHLLPEAGYIESTCPPPEQDPEVECGPNCAFDLTGVIEEPADGRNRVAAVRTDDGMLWVAWIETHLVGEHAYTQICPGEPDPCVCEVEVIAEDRTSRLRVVRYDFVGEPVEVLSMPFEGVDGALPRPRILADAFADRIVVSLVTDGLGPTQDQRGYRVLELDTDAL
jgi:hypothetical protein